MSGKVALAENLSGDKSEREEREGNETRLLLREKERREREKRERGREESKKKKMNRERELLERERETRESKKQQERAKKTTREFFFFSSLLSLSLVRVFLSLSLPCVFGDFLSLVTKKRSILFPALCSNKDCDFF